MTEQEQDEDILARILAYAYSGARPLARGDFGHRVTEGPVCAVGAGILYAGVPIRFDCGANTLFAEAYGVSIQYACGVSDGFEQENWGPMCTADYARGYAVGAAVYAAVLAQDSPDSPNAPDAP